MESRRNFEPSTAGVASALAAEWLEVGGVREGTDPALRSGAPVILK